MKLEFFMLKSEFGYWKRRTGWQKSPQTASVWTSPAGPNSAKGSCGLRTGLEVVKIEGELTSAARETIG